MTEFEMAYLQNDMLLALGAASSLYFATLTAFLVASYLVAQRLTRMRRASAVEVHAVRRLAAVPHVATLDHPAAGRRRVPQRCQ